VERCKLTKLVQLRVMLRVPLATTLVILAVHLLTRLVQTKWLNADLDITEVDGWILCVVMTALHMEIFAVKITRRLAETRESYVDMGWKLVHQVTSKCTKM
jgi:hypothetical protein